MKRPIHFIVLAAVVAIAPIAVSTAQQSAGRTAGESPATEQAPVGLEEVVVTAQRREESAQRAAIAISTISGSDIRDANVSRPETLTKLIPSLQISEAAGPYSIFYLRGVGSFAVNALSDSAVAFNTDNVYVGRPSATNGFFYDLQRVEVLKGPQGTLYGRNATGGAINAISNLPEFGRLSVDATLDAGNYSAFRTDLVVNAPLGEKAALRAAFFRVQHDGYMSDGTDDQKDTGGRLSFRFAPTDDFNMTVVGDYFHQGGKGVGTTVIGLSTPFPPSPSFSRDDRFGLSSPQVTAFLAQQPDLLNGSTLDPYPASGYQDNSFWGISSTINWTTRIGILTAIPAYRDSIIDYISFGPGFQIRELAHNKQKSLELRLASDGDGALRYMIGAFYYDEPDQTRSYNVNQQSSISNQNYAPNTTSRAVFGRLTYAIAPSLRLTGGIRYTKEKKSFQGTLIGNNRICVFGLFGCPNAVSFPYDSFTPATPSQFGPFGPVLSPDGTFTTLSTIQSNPSADYSKVTWRGGIEWDVNDHSLLYASVETGFKAGGFFFSSDSGFYKPESIRAYTLGSKNRFLDDKLQLNVELYYWKYKDQQISHLGFDSGGNIIFPTENVGNATFKGIELEALARPFTNTLLSAIVQYNHGVYDSFTYQTPNTNNGAGNGTGCPTSGMPTSSYTIDCSGQRPPYSPLWSGTLSAQQTIPLCNGARVNAAARVHYQSSTMTDLSFLPVELQSGYAMADLELRYVAQGDRYFVSAYVNNAFDKTALSFSFPRPLSFVATGALQPPRTFGARVGVHF